MKMDKNRGKWMRIVKMAQMAKIVKLAIMAKMAKNGPNSKKYLKISQNCQKLLKQFEKC